MRRGGADVMKRAAGLALALTALAAATGAFAQTPTEDDARWAAINKAVPPPMQIVVQGAIEAAEADCVGGSFTLGPVTPATGWGKIDEAIATGQLANAWTVTTTRTGCPVEQTWGRYLIMQSSGGQLLAQFLHPGRSNMDLFNLTDGAMNRTMTVAANTAARDIPGCSSGMIGRSGSFIGAEIVDDRQIGPAPAGVYRSGSWRESWRFSICGRDLTVFVDFTGGEEGVKATPSGWASLKR